MQTAFALTFLLMSVTKPLPILLVLFAFFFVESVFNVASLVTKLPEKPAMSNFVVLLQINVPF